MMLIFFLGAAQAVPLYKMNNEIVNNNNSILKRRIPPSI